MTRGVGFKGTSEMVAELDGPHVGFAAGLGMLRVDDVYDFEVQCTRVTPGRRDVICTGNLSEARCVKSVSMDCWRPHGLSPNNTVLVTVGT